MMTVLMPAGLSNELTYAGGCSPVSKCFPQLLAAAQQIAKADTTTRPIIITSIFDANFATAVAVRQAFYNAGAQTRPCFQMLQQTHTSRKLTCCPCTFVQACRPSTPRASSRASTCAPLPM